MFSAEDFDRGLTAILDDTTKAAVLSVPGVMELLSEEFNNDVLAWLNRERKESSDD